MFLAAKVYQFGSISRPCQCGAPVCDDCQRQLGAQYKLTIGKINLARHQVREAMLRPVGRFTKFRKAL